MAAPTKSQEGLNFAKWSLLLYLVSLAAGLAGSVVFLALVTTGRFDFDTAVTLAAGVGNPTLLLSLLLVILFFIGFFTLFYHRRELGPGHKRNMDRSLLVFIGIIVVIAVVLVVVAMFFRAHTSFLSTFDLG
ncbi:MAG: hypothetical protein ACE5IJ_09250, partial [Thermoplasmata archaeon]